MAYALKPERQNKETIAYLEQECRNRAKEMAQEFKDVEEAYASIREQYGNQDGLQIIEL